MRTLHRIFCLLLVAGGHLGSQAQPVAKTVLVEHFTNSYCSVCAARNPGFYQNLVQFPQALHISYYPSSPYPACPISQYNQQGADGRANFYGVYGGTPRLVVQGVPVSANANYNDAGIFQNELGKTSSFAVVLELKKLSATVGEARLVLRKVDTSSLDSVSVYAAVVQDTLFFTANNGEQQHYDVFRRSVWGTQPVRTRAPSAVGDSAVLVNTFPIDAVLPAGRIYGIGIVQQKTGAVIQAARSGPLSSATTGVEAVGGSDAFSVYPNPATDAINIENAAGENAMLRIFDLQGRSIKQQPINGTAKVDVSGLPPGQYILRIEAAGVCRHAYFTKH